MTGPGVIDLDTALSQLDHEQLLIRRGPRSGLTTIIAVHSTALGPSLGGVRMWVYGDVDAAVRDALRLSGAMTLKAAAAGLPQGGGKGVIMLPDARALDAEGARTDVLLDFADTVAELDGAYRTAEDVGMTTADMEVLARTTPHVTGLPEDRGGSGDPSPWTAVGVQIAMQVALERRWGSGDLAGRRVVIAGLGHVGSRLAALCAQAGAELVVTDIDEGKRALAQELGAQWVAPEDAIAVEADVFSPCALGGALSRESITRLAAPVVVGAANNQLATDDVAATLAERDVLWIPDFVANAGGIVNIAYELRPEGYDPADAHVGVTAIGDTVRLVLERADADGTTPLQAAVGLAHRRIAAGDPTAV